ncbi:MAG TPA: cupredoxin domain-containing protein [Candidatus Eisenbacteria bacterium]|jgi:plastocyanin
MAPRRSRSRSRTALAVAAGAVAATALAAGCAGTHGSTLPAAQVTARTDAEGIQVVDVEVHSYYYKPSRIIVEAGKPVELVFHFKSFFTPHNFTCNEPDAGIQIDKSAGFLSFRRTKHARFTPKTPGEYRFYCGVGSHRMKGMTGTLVVR